MTTPMTSTAPVLQIPDDPEPAPRRRRSRLRRVSPLTYLTLTFVVLASAAPLYYMVVMASRPNSDITSNPPPLTPGSELNDNVKRVFENPDVVFAQSLVNSLMVSLVATISVVTLSALAGFAFAKLRFRGKNIFLLAVIGTMMVPVQLGLVPLYMLMGWLGLAGTLWSAVLPFLVTGFGVFFMRQYISQAIPDEMIEAARVDGASTLRIFFQVIFPALRPAIAVLGLLTFMERWNDFMWPYLTLAPENPTVQVALSRLSGGYYTDQALVMAGTLLATVPLVLVFVLFGRRIVGGIMEGGVKG
ncbi:carbohydrate ABC transporter permease [Mumia sp. DW29H23]|uniref:carbohydrate ABC transporter permease n=1 Tax=Mumia sp. DW29H23 TaxID=3421241 RepID=UPI003D68A74B